MKRCCSRMTGHTGRCVPAESPVDKSMGKYRALLRARAIRKGDHIPPPFLAQHCGLYSEWQMRSFFAQLEKSRLARYDDDSGTFEVLTDRYS